ncbi:HutD/Ves family protein [Ottowia testudinis]|uniref:HutD family protein n=1 Tax=Ottowia testudinis TaxID=2816950 RepID=A0A975H3A9_9BURK|nr:HutD family protein [Ottowia testudinis]QTD45723.1 HutD family protein [Ottowia testudinis]
MPFRLADIAPTPWKNGGGATREIVCWPPGAALDGFDWRISVATIAADGPFSVFPGIDRSITLLAGDGVLLHGAHATHRLDAPLAPFAFAGESPIHATLLGGASEDFNVMTRRGRCRAQVSVWRAAAELPCAPGHAALVLAVQGDWRCVSAAGAATALPPGSGLWWPPADAAHTPRLAPLPHHAAPALLAVFIEYG